MQGKFIFETNVYNGRIKKRKFTFVFGMMKWFLFNYPWIILCDVM